MKKIMPFILLFVVLLVLTACTEGKQPTSSTNEVTSEANATSESTKESTQPVEVTKETKPTISQKEMSVHFIDVGQGDAILIKSPNHKYMLIDGGVKGAGKSVVSYLRQQGVQELAYVVATHPDADHIGGLISVLNSIKIKKFVDSGKVHTSQTYEEMLTLIDAKNIPFEVPVTGDKLQLDQELQIEVLSADATSNDNNEASIVLKVTYGEVSFLLSADAGVEMEREMLAKDISATILKAGHHGSNTSSSQAFVKKVNPEVTILSYGQDNKYGHPHAETINNVRSVGSKIYGTAEVGTIVVATNGITYNVDKAEWTGIGATSSITPKPSTKPNPVTSTVAITAKDLAADEVTITNNSSEAISLSGWKLVSVEGNQIFKFPNITLQPGKGIIVTSGPDAKEGDGYLKWTGRAIWLNDGDAAQLFNAKGEMVSEFK